MNAALLAWARGRRSRPGLLIRAKCGVAEPGDATLASMLFAELESAPIAEGLASAAWRAIELMDLGAVAPARLDALLALLDVPPPPSLPLVLPSGAVLGELDAAMLAGEALALRALTKTHRTDDPRVRSRLDALARRGPALDGATRRASALHGIAADAVHYPAAVDRLVAGLAAMQHHDGGWGENDLVHVGQALLAVETPEAARVLRRGTDALMALQQGDGGFGSDERSWIACRWLARVGG